MLLASTIKAEDVIYYFIS